MRTPIATRSKGPAGKPWPVAGALVAPRWLATRGWCPRGSSLEVCLKLGYSTEVALQTGAAVERDPAPPAVLCVCAVCAGRSVVLCVLGAVCLSSRYRTAHYTMPLFCLFSFVALTSIFR